MLRGFELRGTLRESPAHGGYDYWAPYAVGRFGLLSSFYYNEILLPQPLVSDYYRGRTFNHDRGQL